MQSQPCCPSSVRCLRTVVFIGVPLLRRLWKPVFSDLQQESDLFGEIFEDLFLDLVGKIGLDLITLAGNGDSGLCLRSCYLAL
ncbi:hypothetical protein [Sphaerochaeta pleomorpha]|uniref:hypothetical protein n=1 Tax=Sphaerochaeta pleomorpha TaxID=1131707 RepID=UPI0012DED919|nr:hypothetical protein [Sphaerochaeta pleomorpha]